MGGGSSQFGGFFEGFVFLLRFEEEGFEGIEGGGFGF